jgi:CRISPR/Cas system-associated endonuclease Cas3-HD
MERVPPMVDMRRTPEEAEEYAIPSPMDQPAYPYGLSISLCQDELEKLGLDHTDFEVGDLVHFHAMSVVTSVSSSQNEGGNTCRVELQITHMTSAEDESDEDEEAEQVMNKTSKLYTLK